MTQEGATRVIEFLYEKLQDVENVQNILLGSWKGPFNFNSEPTNHTWVKLLSLANGLLGPVLFYSICSKIEPRERTNKIIFEYLKQIKNIIEAHQINLNISMYSGLGAFSFVVNMAAEGKKYQTLLASINNSLLRDTENVIDQIEINLTKNEAVPSITYDCIQGICGVIRYLMENMSTLGTAAESVVQRGLRVLIALAQQDSDGLLRCHLDINDPLNASYGKDNVPAVSFNLGLAHGVPGILSILASAMIKGIILSGQAEAISSLSAWLWRQSLLCSGHIRWPYSMVWDEKNKKPIPQSTPSREAWCYGSPGILRALFLGAKVLNDQATQAECLNHFLRIFALSKNDMQIYDYSICHGLSGLYLIAKEMHNDTNHPALQYELDCMHDTILSNFNPSLPFGFCCVNGENQDNKVTRINAGLLEGGAGIGLTLLSPYINNTEWHLPLLIH